MSEPAEVHRFRHRAMAAHFEVIVAQDNSDHAQAVTAKAFTEIDRIESELSRYIGASDISQINQLKPGQRVRVGKHAMECLVLAREVFQLTGGAFDVTVGALMNCWRDDNGQPLKPSPTDIQEARKSVSMEALGLHPEDSTVEVRSDGLQIDLGAIGKGYAIEKAAGILRSEGIGAALLNAGDSTVYAFGNPTEDSPWNVAVGGYGREPRAPAVLQLDGYAVSGSGTFNKGAHIMNAATGRPITAKAAVWSYCASPTVSDALSTAFYVMTSRQIESFCLSNPTVGSLVRTRNGAVHPYGNWGDRLRLV